MCAATYGIFEINIYYPSLLMMASGRKHLRVADVVQLIALSDDEWFEDKDRER